jgi:hypothetical protein
MGSRRGWDDGRVSAAWAIGRSVGLGQAWSVASLGEKIWREWLKVKGYLPNGSKKSLK